LRNSKKKIVIKRVEDLAMPRFGQAKAAKKKLATWAYLSKGLEVMISKGGTELHPSAMAAQPAEHIAEPLQNELGGTGDDSVDMRWKIAGTRRFVASRKPDRLICICACCGPIR
jgi:hypothetical protein